MKSAFLPQYQQEMAIHAHGKILQAEAGTIEPGRKGRSGASDWEAVKCIFHTSTSIL